MKIVQVTLTRTYFKEVTIDVEVENTLIGEPLTDFLTSSEEINNRLESALSEASLDACDEDEYRFDDLEDNNGGHL
jgi:hypothetical protein